MKKYYFIYIITNRYKTVLCVGVTNNLRRRLDEHYNELIKGFSSRYRLKYLVHYEKFTDVLFAISREKEIKKWGKRKKIALIAKSNPEWKFLNEIVMRLDEEFL